MHPKLSPRQQTCKSPLALHTKRQPKLRLCILTCSWYVCASDFAPPGNAASGQPTSQGGPGLDHASISMTHLAGFVQLAESEAHEEHGVDAAQHPRQLLLICLQQQNSFSQFLNRFFVLAVHVILAMYRSCTCLPAALGQLLLVCLQQQDSIPFLAHVILAMYRSCMCLPATLKQLVLICLQQWDSFPWFCSLVFFL